MEIIAGGKALLLRLRNPKQVTTVIPKSQELSANQVVVRWGIDEAHALKSMNTLKFPLP
jgi:hypothetical protein